MYHKQVFTVFQNIFIIGKETDELGFESKYIIFAAKI